ncbi:MAG: alanine racemase [Anaerolineae bacterium UTCFX2]|jgi:alanine racemase|nr:alanine racemase [Anaerolineae bacterium]MCZ7551829.1 alanine racemase [Anaerolineales bacterium]OQY92614.1 MAG: alanine racemase [Anaerolineae bacterium UTCFX2]
MLESFLTWAEIDLDAIAHNVRAYKRHIGENVRYIAVVKANAYGHGAAPVARAALCAGAEMLAVSRVIEGVALRKAGIQAPILLMGYTPPGGAEMAAEWRLTPSLMTFETAQALSQRGEALGYKIPVHVKIDTGMSRYGLFPEEAHNFLNAISGLPGIELEGLFTHFATADAADQTHARRQLAVFERMLGEARQAGFHIPLIHAANSAAAMRLPEAHFDAVRVGIGMYGLDPSSEWSPVFEIRPALSLKSRVSRVRDLPAGAGVSYGRTYVTERTTRAALVSVGYGDGFHRLLSNRGAVLIRGKRAPIIGRVCMDQFVVDASDIPQVQQDDEVVLVGKQGDARIRAEEVAALAETINYEVTTSLLARVVRVYLEDGRVTQVEALGQD